MKTVFDNQATKYKIKRFCGGYIFTEIHLSENLEHLNKCKVYDNKKLCFKAMQNDSKKRYGQEAE